MLTHEREEFVLVLPLEFLLSLSSSILIFLVLVVQLKKYHKLRVIM